MTGTFIRILLAAVSLILWTHTAMAQLQASLVADRISVIEGSKLRAEGNVEVLYRGARLRARAITYDRNTDTIAVQGPLSLSDGSELVILADAAAMDDDLRNGVLTSARLVLDQELQIAAAEINRVNGRYTQLTKAVASTCRVCDRNRIPLWQIRASRIVHDQQERQLYFDNAVFQVVGVPVFYVPRLRLPDPSQDRATGFLIPDLRNSSLLGVGVQIPYFITLGQSADLTIVPYISNRTRTLEFRHRQLWQRGALALNGAVSNDDLGARARRGYLFGHGLFFLDGGYQLGFDIEYSSDDAYTFDYGVSEQDRLQSSVTLQRVTRNTLFAAEADKIRSFRDTEDNDTIPSQLFDVVYEGALDRDVVGGTLGYKIQGFGLRRTSDEDVLGRDYGRLSAQADWRRELITASGIKAGAELQFNADFYVIEQDTTTASENRFTSVGAIDLSWPFAKVGEAGVNHVIEPTAQLVWSDATDSQVPNEEGAIVEFDEGNLFDLNRFAGSSAYEIGTRLNIGATYTRRDQRGRKAALTLGRIFRIDDEDQFTEATGLDRRQSDWLASVYLQNANGLQFFNRLLIGTDASVARNETRLDWQRERFDLTAQYLWLISDASIDREQDTSEFSGSARYDFDQNWTGGADLRYDLVADRAASAGLSLTYGNECINARLGVRRTFTSSTSVEPQTELSFTVGLPRNGRAKEGQRGRCYG